MSLREELSGLITESRNEAYANLDEYSTREILQIINEEDHKVPEAVAKEIGQITKAVDAIVSRFEVGGRLIYAGAGTSGRLGILDASECPPTFNADPDMVIGLMAGGIEAFRTPQEGAEDDPQLGAQDLKELNLGPKDVFCGLAASGRTPYILGAVEYARKVGAVTIGVTCNPGSPLTQAVDIPIAPMVGPEVLTGSTRLKAGTATKLVINMLTTTAMIRLGKVYGNLMVDLQATNEKLEDRSIRIIRMATGASEEEAISAFHACDRRCKPAVVMILAGVSAQEAYRRLEKSNGRVRPAIAGEE